MKWDGLMIFSGTIFWPLAFFSYWTNLHLQTTETYICLANDLTILNIYGSFSLFLTFNKSSFTNNWELLFLANDLTTLNIYGPNALIFYDIFDIE